MPSSTKSLHSLSVHNPKFQLHPLFWTSYHTSIVNCVFQQFEDDDLTAPTTFVSDPFSDTTNDAKRLATDVGPREKFVWVESMFRRPGSPIIQIDKSPYFSYHQHVVKYTCTDLHVFCIKKEQVVNHGDPIIGYYRYNASKERRKSFTPRRAPRGLTNNPVKRLYDIRYRRVIPPDWRQDPYLFCLILSLAQLHRPEGTVSLAGDIQTRLLVTHMSDSTYAYVYKADIPQQLLECLDNPKRPMDDFAFPNVAWIKILFKPYSTFADRLQSHLVCPGSEPTSTSLGGKKRKHD
ncbi:hypothetical protein FIE12Z_6256 [Fusarium flagelliforme]|uniref:Uncharacterized protein n=1 Tax=Fusarium flagelliforme TaxID=2675880 RepID=A0A395MNZ1_9HYPO|nr:hypothetical protein FIE12Z_6256 [Fusarium flagelliforme]